MWIDTFEQQLYMADTHNLDMYTVGDFNIIFSTVTGFQNTKWSNFKQTIILLNSTHILQWSLKYHPLQQITYFNTNVYTTVRVRKQWLNTAVVASMNERKPVVNTNVYDTVSVRTQWLNTAVVASMNERKPVVNTNVYATVSVSKQWLNTAVVASINERKPVVNTNVHTIVRVRKQ